MTIGKLSGQCDFGQKGQSYCNQRGQSCVAKRVKVAWLFQSIIKSKNLAFYKMILAEDTTNPTFYAYFRGFMALFLGFGLKVKL